jgi:hypothetical protein
VLALEPLISKFCRSRAPVAPVYFEQASRPLIGNRTLRGSVLSEPGARAARGSSLPGKGPGLLMPAVADAVRHRCRARSGRGGQADVTAFRAPRLPRRNDSARADVRPPRSWWVPLVNGRNFYLQLMRAGVRSGEHGPWGYKPNGGRQSGFLPSHLVFATFAPLASAPEPHSLFRRHAILASRSSLIRPLTWLPHRPSPSLTR